MNNTHYVLRRIFVIISSSVFVLMYGEGFVAGTLVKTDSTFVPIEQIAIGDTVVCCSSSGDQVLSTVAAINFHVATEFITLCFENDILICEHDQFFILRIVPPGVGALAHRGPHWDVIDKKVKHKNILPGGRVC